MLSSRFPDLYKHNFISIEKLHSHPPSLGNYHSILCFSEFDYFSYIYPSVTDLFHLAQCHPCPSMMSQRENFFIFKSWVIFHCMYISHFHMSMEYGLFLFCFLTWLLKKNCCNEHGIQNISSKFWFKLFWIYTRVAAPPRCLM